MKFADLHLHTQFSDGTFTPEELAGHGQRLGFAAMALTDHDSVEGCARMTVACDTAGIEFIPGTELTAEFGDTELHLLGYFLDTHNEKLLTEIAKFQIVRQNRIHEMVAAINKLGVPLEAETVFALANCKSPGRPARRACAGESRARREPRRGIRAVSEKEPACVGAQGQNVST